METTNAFRKRTNSIEHFTTVGNVVGGNLRVTKVTETSYGFSVRVFNEYVTVGKLRITVDKHANKFKISWTIERNYSPCKRYTTYHMFGEEVDRSTYHGRRAAIQTLLDTSELGDVDEMKEYIAQEDGCNVDDVSDDEAYQRMQEDVDMWRWDVIEEFKKIIDGMRECVFVGKVGTWRGTFPGGRYVHKPEDLWRGSYDDVKVYIDHKQKRVYFAFSDHDGTSTMELRERRRGVSDETWDALDDDYFAKAYNVTKSTYNQINAYYNG